MWLERMERRGRSLVRAASVTTIKEMNIIRRETEPGKALTNLLVFCFMNRFVENELRFHCLKDLEERSGG
jgi:hypothetical protein